MSARLVRWTDRLRCDKAQALPLRIRLTLWYVGLLAVVLVGFGGYLYASLEQRLRTEVDRSLEVQVTRVLPPDEVLADFPSLPLPPSVPPSVSPGSRPLAVDGIAASLYDPSGQTFIVGETIGDLPALVEARLVAGTGSRDLRTVVTREGAHWRVLTVPITRLGRTFGVFQLARSEADSQTALRELLFLMSIGIPTTLLLAIAIGLFLAGRALDPIDRITRTAAQIGASDLSRRLAFPTRHDEVGRMAATFDAMLDRLEAAFDRQRRFTADASHELRTPLALLIARAEVALEQRRPPNQYREALESVRDDGRRMGQLLGDMLMLARADDGQLRLQLEELDLTQLVADCVMAMLPLATSQSIRLTVRTPQTDVIIDGDQTRLTQLLVNLIDNALKYTSAGGSVTVVVDIAGSLAIIRVIDTGIGIASENLTQIFERFYRVDDARARADGGAGLGLAICRWIVDAHGGSIEAESCFGEGSSFTVRLPCRASRPVSETSGRRRSSDARTDVSA